MSYDRDEIFSKLRESVINSDDDLVISPALSSEGENILLPVNDYTITLAMKNTDDGEWQCEWYLRGIPQEVAVIVLHQFATKTLESVAKNAIHESLHELLTKIPREKVYATLGEAGVPVDQINRLYTEHSDDAR